MLAACAALTAGALAAGRVATAGLVGLLAAPGVAALWMTVIGVARGRSLSAGYLLCSIGPTLVGLAHDLTGS